MSFTMNETFMRIHQLTLTEWEDKILKYFPKEISHYRKESGNTSFLSFKIGFYPYELKNKSGSRIFHVDGSKPDNNINDTNKEMKKQPKIKAKKDKKNDNKINFIMDPELKYLKRDKNPFSITYVLDLIFEKICNVVDESLSNYFGLHFFIRRCFAGCEFGVCVDPLFDKIEIEKKHCLFDLQPLLLCTISCKSEKPLIAGILLILLVFITVITVKIVNYITRPDVSIKDVLKVLGEKLWEMVKKKCINVVNTIIENISPINKALNNIIRWLEFQILSLLRNQNDIIATIMRTVLSLIETHGLNKLDDGIKIKMSPLASNLFSSMMPISNLVKIGILFLLLIAAFLKNFQNIKALKNESNSYQKEFKDKECFHSNMSNEKIDDFETYKDVKTDFENTHKKILLDEIENYD